MEKLREAVPRAVNALADAMEQLERQRPVVEAAVAAVAYIRGRLGDRIEDRLPLMPASSQALYRAVEAMQKAEKGGCDDA